VQNARTLLPSADSYAVAAERACRL